ncbi:MAG TPA: FAD-binding protein, partial [Chloroflexota bacterium]|nr:FAD-binding protein [Chloroflexota bacterium]
MTEQRDQQATVDSGMDRMDRTGGTVLEDPPLEQLRAALRGPVLRPGDEGFQSARQVWNGMIDRTPALIVRAAGAADVISAVHFARDHDLPLALHGGGHSAAGNGVCDGGVMLDLSGM